MAPLGNDRHRGFVPDQLGPWKYDVIGWMAHAETWRQGMVKKLAAGHDVAVDMEIGRRRVVAIIESPAPGTRDVDLDRLRALADDLGEGDPSTLDDDAGVPCSTGASRVNRWLGSTGRCGSTSTR